MLFKEAIDNTKIKYQVINYCLINFDYTLITVTQKMCNTT